ncbi:MAG: ribose 5-phosphate isomerase B [Phycisphaeraceae bacterium]|nr:ribose 5-phosphate isomerase B [Phycisphaeraceae bacterium]MCW5753145.1 ribose 5-phosphate isomerase B [Phycisphaeraceae bacterium]
MNIAVGADHRGIAAARNVVEKLRREGHQVSLSEGCDGPSCDYPERAFPVAKAVAAGEADRGILICGTGIGMSIAANKVAGVRAAVVHDELTAELSRSHNDANILCLSADLLGQRLIENIVDVFLRTSFEGGRHLRRVRKIGAIESGQDPAEVVEG